MDEQTILAGIDLGGTNIKFGLCRFDGAVISQFSIPAEVEKGTDALIERITGCGKQLADEAARLGFGLRSVGVGTPGVVDPKEGRVVGMSPNIPGWEKVEIRRHLEAKLGMTVHVENDVNAMAIAEHMCGAAAGFANVLTATVGTGIGGGLIVDGKLYRGGIGSAGEIGHITVVKDGELCGCGRRGCLEKYASAGSLAKYATEAVAECGETSVLKSELSGTGTLSVKSILGAFGDGDPAASAAVFRTVDFLACGLASVLAVMNPDVLVIGGGIVEGGGVKFLDMAAERIHAYAIQPSVTHLTIRSARLGNNAGFIGSALISCESCMR